MKRVFIGLLNVVGDVFFEVGSFLETAATKLWAKATKLRNE
jgi:hypothetical protein